MTGARRLASVAAITLVLSTFAGCFTDSCACVRIAPTRTERWIGHAHRGDSLDLSMTIATSGPLSGSGVVRTPAGVTQSITIEGVYDETAPSPSQFTITGWFASAATWVRTTPRRDSLYGIVHLSPGIAVGDTLGLSLYRAK